MEYKIKAPTKNESRTIKFLILLGIFSVLNFIIYFFQPEHAGNPFLYALLIITISYSIFKKLYMWYNYSNISIPEKPVNSKIFKVDILTTYFPGEPYQMVITTLEAINNITYPHTTYLCDEANDPYLKQFCEENGIHHITRDNRIDAKAGNINNALRTAAKGEICVVLDPDHIPEPNFLDAILPYFEDPKIGFVQIVQAYYNIKETLVARGAAEQTFQFYGPMMMTLNSYGAVNAIGANCVFRREALDSIGGHAPGLCEDMHTAMLLYAKGWKAVYLPEILARGLAPSNLTNFYKQQLKWSRGTFDLLVNVYPKIFKKLTGRQRIHYGILPLHYFAGVIIFINFLIPIVSLFLSTTPWSGNIMDFILVLLPVALSSLLIRTYIQKWVIEKKERGFHLLGGLLHINTWWIYLLGLVYTIMGKKVPYLPTPKEDEWNTNFKIIIPNALIALISIIAIIYGLQKDFTPFSLVMAGFALFNAFIMIFGIYLTIRVTNHNKILRANLDKKSIVSLWTIKQGIYKVASYTFAGTRYIAPVLLLIFLIISMGWKNKNDLAKWEHIEATSWEKINMRYTGIYHPMDETGLSNIEEIKLIENQQDVNFDIVSIYLAWNEESLTSFPLDVITGIYQKKGIPMITWEPWGSQLPGNDSIKELNNDQKVFQHISKGHFDTYIRDFAKILKSFDKPIFLRFAHEFDNPQYPWSREGNNTPEDFKEAWQYVHKIFESEGLDKVVFVWNPWKAESMEEYYPGDQYVDWVGITLLNYGPFNPDGKYYTFEELYNPFHKTLKTFTRKPVMLAEFGAVKLETNRKEWMVEAVKSMNSQFPEIAAMVQFNSAFDENIPANDWYSKNFIDWTTNSIKAVHKSYKPRSSPGRAAILPQKSLEAAKNPITVHTIKGVKYEKGRDWINNYYALTKETLLKDFKLMREIGINTIQYTGENIYDTNFLTYSNDFDLKVIYEFKNTEVIDYINDKEKLISRKKEILDKVRSLKNEPHIIGYSFKYNLPNHFVKPLLFSQEIAYINWINPILSEIRTIDPQTSLVMDVELKQGTLALLNRLNTHLPIDSFGLIVEELPSFKAAYPQLKEQNISFFLSSFNSQFLDETLNDYEDLDIVLQNWQDKRISNAATFEGLVDFKGRKKEEIKNVERAWTGKKVTSKNIPIAILKPSVPLVPGNTETFQALMFHNGEWIDESNSSLEFEWYLIKNDNFGNSLAIKELGSGPILQVKIPENYKDFELMLVSREKGLGHITSTRSSLHTPAVD